MCFLEITVDALYAMSLVFYASQVFLRYISLILLTLSFTARTMLSVYVAGGMHTVQCSIGTCPVT